MTNRTETVYYNHRYQVKKKEKVLSDLLKIIDLHNFQYYIESQNPTKTATKAEQFIGKYY